MKAIFDIIREAMVDGELPANFHLPDNGEGGSISWAEGAMDGILIYHAGTPNLTEEQYALMCKILDAAGEDDIEQAETHLKKIMSGELGQVRALYIIDPMQSYIVDNREKLVPNNMFKFAMHQILTSTDKECVKIGLSILELLKSDIDEKFMKYIRIVGLSDELTVFALYAISRWDDANDYTFDLAKRVHGWGRVHAVRMLEPATDEIKDWLIEEGVHNNVMAAYSAYECWSKGDAEARLGRELKDEEYAGIRDIIEGLLDEGPVLGISRVENACKHMCAFLEQSKGRVLGDKDYELIRKLKAYFDKQSCEDVVKLCEEMIIC